MSCPAPLSRWHSSAEAAAGQWELVRAVRLQLARVLLSPASAGEPGSVHRAHGTFEGVAAGAAVGALAPGGCGSASAISESRDSSCFFS